MCPCRPQLSIVPCLALALLLGACFDGPQTPGSRSGPPAGEETGILEPLDLVYVCGNKFLATNSTKSPAHVVYRVAGTNETGSLTLDEEPGEDPGYSETELETKGRGVVELYHDDERVARRRNGGTPCGADPASRSIAALGASVSAGEWTAQFSWPVVALHLSLLPTGKVLSWGLNGTPQLWDPATGGFTSIPSPAQLFCAGHSFLPDGRLLVSGGHISNNHGIADNTIFTPGSQSWSRSTPMRRGRWYPTNTMLANGEVVILAGTDEDAVVVEEPEVWSSGSVRVLSTAKRSLPYYPRTFLAPNGKIFYAGHQQTTRYLDPTGTGSWTTVGNRLYSAREYGAAVMYEPGRILYVGGGRTTNTAEVIDLNAAAPGWRWTGSMAFPRRSLNATVLPTGDVLVTGGTSGTRSNDVAQAVRAAELWSPTTGTWTTLASNGVSRAYHSTSILLRDGRVLHAGSGDGAAMPNERNAELFSPPYLFQGARPVITAAPSLVAYGTSFRIRTPDAVDIAKVSLIRLGSTTHAFDMNQRFQWLSFELESGGLRIAVPSSRNHTPPGHYMLFILNGTGVPSVAKIVNVGTASEPDPPPPTNAPPTAAFTSSCNGFVCDFTDASTDDVGVTGWSWEFGDGGTSTLRHPSRTYAAAGTYEVTLTVTDNAGATNRRSATVTPIPPTAIALSATGRIDGTRQRMTLTWSGASGTTVDIYRNGSFLRNTANDGGDSNARIFQGAATYVFKVCQAGTSVCSNEATVQFTGGITLAATGRIDGTRQTMTLTWGGASGATVDIYRNGSLLRNTPNDGRDTNGRNFQGAATYVFKVCQAGTSTCSNEATVVF